MEYGKRDLSHGSKLTVLSMLRGYLATKTSCDTSCCVGSLNNSGITVKEGAGHSRLKSQPATHHGECGLKRAVGDWIKVKLTHGKGLIIQNPLNAAVLNYGYIQQLINC